MIKFLVLTSILGFSLSLFAADTATPTCKATCNYRDEGAGSTFVGESKKDCKEACADGEKKCKEKARGECKKIKCLSNCPDDQTSTVSSDMQFLARIEMQNPELQNQVAGGCGVFWSNSDQRNETICQSNTINGVNGALVGALIGSLGGTNGAVGGAVVGFGLFYALSYSKYGAD